MNIERAAVDAAGKQGTLQTAERIARLTASPVRDILRVAGQPGVISFAGGLPDRDSFPQLSSSAIGSDVLQYGATEGEDALRQWIAEDLEKHDLVVSPEHVLILSGSQQGIDLVAKMFVSKHTLVAVETPTYLAALQVFNLFGARYASFEPGHGPDLLSIKPALTYCIPTFQNPTGYCYTDTERQQLAECCDANGSVLFEDDPYRELAYDDCDRKPVCSYVRQSSWIYQSSFSKTLAPGLRLGYLVCSPSLYPTLCWLKQAADLHSNRLSQQLVLSMVQRSDYHSRQREITDGYRHKRDHFDGLLHQYFAGLASWIKPAGGLFFWLRLCTPVDTHQLLRAAIAEGVAFMPGETFFTESSQLNSYIRLNFSNASELESSTGLRILARLLRSKCVGNS